MHLTNYFVFCLSNIIDLQVTFGFFQLHANILFVSQQLCNTPSHFPPGRMVTNTLSSELPVTEHGLCLWRRLTEGRPPPNISGVKHQRRDAALSSWSRQTFLGWNIDWISLQQAWAKLGQVFSPACPLILFVLTKLIVPSTLSSAQQLK